MGCGCGGNSSGVAPTRLTPIVQTCTYTLEQLNSLLGVVQPTELSIVTSQINVYNTNCNMFSNIITPLLTFYNL